MPREELSDLSLRLSAPQSVVERLAAGATGAGAQALAQRRADLDALALNPDTMADIRHAVSFERLLLKGVKAP